MRPRFLQASGALLLLLAAGGCGPIPLLPAATGCLTSHGTEVLELVNRARARTGLPPLSPELRLVAAARHQSAHMADRRILTHRGPGGTNVGGRVEARGYDWLEVAENVASGQPTAADVFGSWWESPGHRANILHPAARDFGLARAEGGGVPYWTMVVARTDGDPEFPLDGCHP